MSLTSYRAAPPRVGDLLAGDRLVGDRRSGRMFYLVSVVRFGWLLAGAMDVHGLEDLAATYSPVA